MCDLYIQSIIARTAWQPIGPMLAPPKKSSWIPQVSLTPYDVFLLLSSSSRMASVIEITPSGPGRFPVKYSLVTVIINLPIVSTDGVFEVKKRQEVRTTEPRHSARQQQHALGVLVPVLNLVSYRRMSAECF